MLILRILAGRYRSRCSQKKRPWRQCRMASAVMVLTSFSLSFDAADNERHAAAARSGPLSPVPSPISSSLFHEQTRTVAIGKQILSGGPFRRVVSEDGFQHHDVVSTAQPPLASCTEGCPSEEVLSEGFSTWAARRTVLGITSDDDRGRSLLLRGTCI